MTTTDDRQTLLRNGTLFDGAGAPPRPGVDLLLQGGRILAVGTDAAPAAGADELDLAGRTVMPGLIDCHVHLIMRGDPAEVSLTPPTPELAWNASENARRTLEAGVTAVRDLGARDAINVHLRDAIDAGRLPGPRIRAVAALITMTGGHGWWMGRQADGPDDVRKAVREQLRAGADCIKLIATGGVMTPRVDPRSAQFTEDELRAGVEEAHKALVRVAAHAQATAGIRNAVRAGVDSIEHGIYLDDEVIEEMRVRGAYLVPTLAAPHNITRHGLAAGIPAYAVEKSERVIAAHNESFRRAVAAGVRIAMGTDAGTPLNRHGENAQELALMVEAGMTPIQALVAATRNAADLLDLLADTGTLEPGKAADLLILDGDPTEDIGLLTRPDGIVGVLRGGHWVRRGAALGATTRANER